MERENKSLKVLVIILCILVLGLGGYFVYDRILNVKDIQGEDNDTSNDLNDNVNNGQENEDILLEEIKAVFEFVYNYYDVGNAYCGKQDGSDYITTSKTPSNGFYASTDFTSYDEMTEYLKKYMSEEVIYIKNTIKKEYYVEQNGKLYCEDLGKGGNIYQPENIILQINSISDDSINVTAAVQLSTSDNYKDYNNYDVIFNKNNDNWIITSYKKQD